MCTHCLRGNRQYWLDNITLANRDYAPKQVNTYTDTSLHGWGYYNQTHQHHYGEQWDESVSDMTHINVLELRVVLRMLHHQGNGLKEKHVMVFADNTTAMICIPKGGSTRFKQCQQETEKIWEITEERAITISIKYCPGVDTTEVGWASWVFTDAGG